MSNVVEMIRRRVSQLKRAAALTILDAVLSKIGPRIRADRELLLAVNRIAEAHRLHLLPALSGPVDAGASGHESQRAFDLKVLDTIFSTIGVRFKVDYQFMLQAWEIAEARGLHLLPVHYYSPLVTRAEVLETHGTPLFDGSLGVRLDAEEQMRFLRETVLPFAPELRAVPMAAASPGTFYWSNGMFDPQDATTYYGMVRSGKPRRVLEVGSGYSTLVASKAAALNPATIVQCIEPYPIEFFNRHLTQQCGYELIQKRAQDVDLSVFAELSPGDILFIDSSHVVKPGSDVEFLIFRVLPILRPGVIVHIHDIFFPYRYDKTFYLDCHWYLNENYIVAALLASNPTWRIRLANGFLSGRGACEEIARAVSSGDEQFAGVRRIAGGSSLWLEKLA